MCCRMHALWCTTAALAPVRRPCMQGCRSWWCPVPMTNLTMLCVCSAWVWPRSCQALGAARAEAGLFSWVFWQGRQHCRVYGGGKAPALLNRLLTSGLCALVGSAATRAAFARCHAVSSHRRLRPACLARYRARSARAISWSRLSSLCSWARPMLVVMARSWP